MKDTVLLQQIEELRNLARLGDSELYALYAAETLREAANLMPCFSAFQILPGSERFWLVKESDGSIFISDHQTKSNDFRFPVSMETLEAIHWTR